MKEEKNIWIKSVMNSHEGKIALEPNQSLFDDILSKVTKAKPVSVRFLRFAGVAASVLVFINVIAIQNVNTQTDSEASYIVYENDVQLISDYNLYEYE